MPFKSSNARSVGKFLPVYSNDDLSLLEDKNFVRHAVFNATGGTRVASGIEPGNGYRYHVWTSPGNLTVQNAPGSLNVEFLVVGGGGSGGGAGAGGHGGNGGGGGGGVKVGTALPLQPGIYTITVGAKDPTSPTRSGTPSSITHPAHTDMIGLGGGGGGADPSDTVGTGPTVGSGGGSWGGGGAPAPGATGQPSQPTDYTSTNYGYNGGGGANGPAWAGGGGGGAGSVGQTNPNNSNAGNGGDGQPLPAYTGPLLQAGVPTDRWPTFGPSVGPTGMYAGGGAGGAAAPNWGGSDGAGGPGGGGNINTNGADNGSGGGAFSPNGADPPGEQGWGGTGIVVIRYQI